MIDFEVRPAVRRDVSALVTLWQEMMDYHRAFDDRFQFAHNAQREVERHFVETLRSRDAHIVVADHSGAITGYILGEMHVRRPIYPVGSYGFISDICVTAAWRRRGVGRALVESLDEWFVSRKITTIELLAAALNPHSIAFWQSLGYTDYLRLMRRDLNQQK